MDLEHQRIEVTDLIFTTFPLALETTIQVQRFSNEHNMPPTRGVTTLHRLRCMVFIFLADLCALYPHLEIHPCLKILVDGHLRPREAHTDSVKFVVKPGYTYALRKLDRAVRARTQWLGLPAEAHYKRETCECASRGEEEGHKTLLSSAMFLGRFVKQSVFPAGAEQHPFRYWPGVCGAVHWG